MRTDTTIPYREHDDMPGDVPVYAPETELEQELLERILWADYIKITSAYHQDTHEWEHHYLHINREGTYYDHNGMSSEGSSWADDVEIECGLIRWVGDTCYASYSGVKSDATTQAQIAGRVMANGQIDYVVNVKTTAPRGTYTSSACGRIRPAMLGGGIVEPAEEELDAAK